MSCFKQVFWLWWAHAKETLGFKGKGWIWQNEEREETSFLQGSPWRSDCCLWFQRKVCKDQLMFRGDEKLWKVFVCFGINLHPSSCHCAHAQEPLHAHLSVFAPMARGLKDSEILKETVMKQVTFLHLLSLVSALLLKHKNAQWSFAILSKNRGDRLFFFFFFLFLFSGFHSWLQQVLHS